MSPCLSVRTTTTRKRSVESEGRRNACGVSKPAGGTLRKGHSPTTKMGTTKATGTKKYENAESEGACGKMADCEIDCERESWKNGVKTKNNIFWGIMSISGPLQKKRSFFPGSRNQGTSRSVTVVRSGTRSRRGVPSTDVAPNHSIPSPGPDGM